MRRGATLDLAIVVAVCALAAGRTPVGALTTWGVDRIRGVERPLPSLLAFFHTTAPAPPLPADLAPLLAPIDHPAADTLPPAVAHVVHATGPPARFPDAEAALADLSARGDDTLALERWALGDAIVDRAVARALAAGADDPTRWEALRSWVPVAAAVEGDRLIAGSRALATVLDLTWPIAGEPRVSSGYGYREHPVLGTRRFHNGIDLAVPIGTPVRSAQRGHVAVVGENGTSGKFVVVDHGHGVRTTYCHLDATAVQTGDPVEAGDRIATSGNTGRSTGPHLHFMVRLGGDTVDPAQFRRSDRPARKIPDNAAAG